MPVVAGAFDTMSELDVTRMVCYDLMRLRHRVAAGWSELEPGGSGYDDQPRGGT
jgi:hypothetical protein